VVLDGGDRPIVVNRQMHELHRLLQRVADTDITVLLLGETGVGKEVFASRLHQASPRASKKLVEINCGALPETLLESELFGHERGAFTGAERAKVGQLEQADGGTVFLDEVGEMPLSVQVKLLRVLETREFTRVGGAGPRKVDVRFVAATNRDLSADIAAGRFRQDLYFRLDGLSILIPPLRERPDEIVPLAEAFLEQAAQRAGRAAPTLKHDAVDWLKRHAWPGNVRELRNVIERALVLSVGDEIARADLPESAPAIAQTAVQTGSGSLGDVERQHILGTLERCGGNQSRTARELGISRNTLLARLKDYGITGPRKGR
jgi:transcriptional regulator with PAS, ATPase and Fis domain